MFTDYFDRELVNHQVEYLSLMENLRVRRAGFAYRRQYDLFLQRYKCLCPTTWPNYKGECKDGVIEICSYLQYQLDIDYSLGRSKIFIRSSKTFFALEEHFGVKKMVLASKIKALYKGYKQRCEYNKIKRAGIYNAFFKYRVGILKI